MARKSTNNPRPKRRRAAETRRGRPKPCAFCKQKGDYIDWKDVSGVLEKVGEEVAEFSRAVKKRDAAGMEEELGDLLFTIVNVARFLEVNPEDALRKTIGKFITRFHHVEKRVVEGGSTLSTTSIEELERLWEEAKKVERKKSEQKRSI